MRPISVQHMYFQKCLSPSLQAQLDPKIAEGVPVFGERSCVLALITIFDTLYLEDTRQSDFCLEQQPGELFSNFSAHLKVLGREANLKTLTENDIFLF